MEDISKVYIPSDDLFVFAEEFSKKFKELSVGSYRSDDERYNIEYSEIINDIYNSDGILRIETNKGIINISKSRIEREGITSFGVLFLIIWGDVYFNVKKRVIADVITIRYLEKLKYPMTDIFKTLKILLNGNDHEAKLRLHVLTKNILEIKKKRDNGNIRKKD